MKPSSDREAVTLIINGLIERGVIPVSVEDGEHEEFSFDHENMDSSIDELMSCDEGWLNVTIPASLTGDKDTDTWIYFVYGNDPEEVACDYGVSLSPYLDPIINPWWE